MCKYILLILILVLIALMAVAAVVVQQYGWVGFLILLGVLAILGFVVRKGMRPLLMYVISRPLRQWGAALRGGRIIVHSIEPCDPPREEEYDVRDDPEAIDGKTADYEDSDDQDEEPTGPFDWYQVEFTVVPPGGESSEGRIVTRRGWSPQLIGAVGPRSRLGTTSPFRGWPPPDQFPGEVQSLPTQVWTGAEYEEAIEQVFGEHRLRMRVGVTRAVRSVTITYTQFTDLGVIDLPRIEPSGADG
jgi:hypothetical protein